MGIFSSKCRYALQAALELARNEGRGPLTICAIAERQGIPARFLESILRDLKTGGVAESLRGKEGGYILSRPARKILISEIVGLFRRSNLPQGEGRLTQAADESNGTGLSLVKQIELEGEQALQSVFRALSLEELLKRERQAASIQNYII